jgi:hypothetical protein
MHMKLQILKQNTIRFVVAYFRHIAIVIIAIVVVINPKSLAIMQIYPIREMPTITALVTVCKNYFY